MTRARHLVGLLVLVLLLAGCRAEAPAPVGFTDDLGRSVVLAAPPERVVPLAPSMTEVVAAAAGVERLVAVSPHDHHPPAVRDLPRIGIYPLDVEAVVAHRADLAVGTTQINDPADGDRLGELGVPTVYFRFERLADVPRVLRRVGALLGTEARADSAAAAFEARLAELEATRPEGPPPRTLVLIGDDVLYAFGGASYVHEMVRLAGGASLTAAFEGEGVTLSPEFVLREQPERIVVLGVDYDPERLTRRHPAFRGLPAVVEGRVCGVDPDLIGRPGPRLVEGVAALRHCILGG